MRDKNKNKQNKMLKLGIVIAIPVVVGIIIFAFVFNGLRIDKIKEEIKNGNYIVAEEMLEDYESSNSSSADVYKLYAELYLAQNQPEKALEKLQDGLKRVSSGAKDDLQKQIDEITAEYKIYDTNEEPSTITQNTQATVTDSKYLTATEWADTSNYMFAVEIDSFNGDIFEAGNYLFTPINVVESASNTPTVWDIYISNNCYNNISQLADSEYVNSVGGYEKLETTINLTSGQYVYIIYNETALTPTGMLKIKKQ